MPHSTSLLPIVILVAAPFGCSTETTAGARDGGSADAFSDAVLDQGPAGSRPVIANVAAARLRGVRYEVRVVGTDADADWTLVQAQFFDSEGRIVSTERSTVDGARGPELDLALIAVDAFDAVEVEVIAEDSENLRSELVRVPIADARSSSLGEVCGPGEQALCASGLRCSGGTCSVPGDVARRCADPNSFVVFAAPGGPALMLGGTLELGGAPLFDSSCLPHDDGGREDLHFVRVPREGSWDLVLEPHSTTVYVHVRERCGDPSTELLCHDLPNVAVVENAPAGDLAIVVETNARFDTPSTRAYSLDVRLRPVLPSGAPCDPAGRRNRCANDACPRLSDPTCP